MRRTPLIAGLVLLGALGLLLWGLGGWVWVAEPEVGGLEEGARGVLVSAEARKVAGTSVVAESVRGERRRVEESVEEAGRVVVRCLTTDKMPIPGAKVEIRIYDRYWGKTYLGKDREPKVEESVVSDAKGEAVFRLAALETHALLLVNATSETHSIRSTHRALPAGKKPAEILVLTGWVRDFRIEGRVLDEKGQALSGADVYCVGNGEKQTVLTDHVGSFVLFVPRLGELHVRASAPGRHRQWQIIPTPINEEGATCVFRLGKGRSASGRVVNREGQPVVDAMVTISSKDSQEGATTDSEGRFVIQHLDPTGPLRQIHVSHTDYLSTVKDLAEKVGKDSGGDLGVFRLERGISVNGRVLDPSGRPVQGATVFLIHTLDRLDRITDEAGRFSYAGGIPKGRLRLLAKAPGYGAGTLELQATANEGRLRDITLKLGDDHSISGRIRDHKGHPVAGVRVSAYRLDDSWGFGLEKSALSDAQGRYKIAGLPLEKLRVYVHGSRLWRTRSTESRVDVQDLDFALDPILWLRLRVLDAKTGKPIPEVQITGWIPEEAVTSIPFRWIKDPKRPDLRGWRLTYVPKSSTIEIRIPELQKAQRMTLVIEAEGYKATTIESLEASTNPKLQTLSLSK